MCVPLRADEVCSADLLCVTVRGGQQVTLNLRNATSKPLSFRLFLTGSGRHRVFEPLFLSRPMSMELARFPRPAEPWGFEFRVHYGHRAHRHDDAHVYRLPYPAGAAHRVSQSHTNLSTHRLGNRFALDFDMPEGEPVHAARSGRVVSTYDQAQGVADDGSVTANHVWIQHEDGTIGKYLHLQTAGVMVEEGAMVSAGQFIGFSGNTGFSRGPHLHFSVSTLGGDALYQTFNLRFATREGVQTLVSGRQYAHGTLPLQAP